MIKKDNKKQQRKAIEESVKKQLKVFQLSGNEGKEASISLPKIPDMNEDNIKPFFYDILGYTPEVISFNEMLSVVVITIKMK